MDKSVTKELVIAGVIGGITSLALAFAARKIMRRSHCKGGRGKWGQWGQSKIVEMTSDKMPKAVGPYSLGKMIVHGRGTVYAWSSGQLGLDPATNELA